MDSYSHVDPFLVPSYSSLFETDTDARNGLKCQVLEFYRPQEVTKIVLSKPSRWERWFRECQVFKAKNPAQLPTDGACILFIPRAEDIVPNQIQADLKDLPISQTNWIRVARQFYLPGHVYKAITRRLTSVTSIPRQFGSEKLLMVTAMTSKQASHRADNFAVSATHFESARLTLAVMIGCSLDQMDRVEDLIRGSEEAVGHPLLILGVFAELHLDLLKSLVAFNGEECKKITKELEDEGPHEVHDHTKSTISWGLIRRVRLAREKSKRAEEEVRATRRQLAKALPPTMRVAISSEPGINGLLDRDSMGDDSDDDDNIDEEVLNMFRERFADIFAQFEGLIADCRISVEEMSFTADIIRSELARQEAKTSGQEAKISTVIAFVAMLYLPMTTVATIFAMPVFQFTNDWRDWHYKPVDKAASDNSSAGSGPDGDPNSPVFSGYFWIYLGISTAFTMLTIEGWWRFTSREIDRRRGHHWLPYSARKLYRHMRDLPGSIFNLIYGFLQTLRPYLGKQPEASSSEKASQSEKQSQSYHDRIQSDDDTDTDDDQPGGSRAPHPTHNPPIPSPAPPPPPPPPALREPAPSSSPEVVMSGAVRSSPSRSHDQLLDSENARTTPSSSNSQAVRNKDGTNPTNGARSSTASLPPQASAKGKQVPAKEDPVVAQERATVESVPGYSRV